MITPNCVTGVSITLPAQAKPEGLPEVSDKKQRPGKSGLDELTTAQAELDLNTQSLPEEAEQISAQEKQMQSVPELQSPPASFIPHKLMPFVWLSISALIIFLDLWTKQIATDNLTLYRPVEITSWLNMMLAHNYGAAFSFLSQAGGWQRWFFSGLAAVVSLILVIWMFRLTARERLTGLALCMIIGGAIGNLVDRINHGYVVDFIDVYYKTYHWPAFNVADSAITCGIILLLFDGFFVSGRAEKSAAD
jgi:signal peptidase II